jgi:16S rRNA (guanine966-N2)-methyltransferase
VFRVTSGSARGRKLKGPQGLQFRPTTGLVKKCIFSYPFMDVRGAKILDLFAGAGSLGIEAMSRGGREVVFVENNPIVVKVLHTNIHQCGFSAESKIHREDVFYFMEKTGRKKQQFDFIFADPPYQKTWRERIVEMVDRNDLLTPEGLLILEHGKMDPDLGSHRIRLLKQKTFGHCIVSIYGEDKK